MYALSNQKFVLFNLYDMYFTGYINLPLGESEMNM